MRKLVLFMMIVVMAFTLMGGLALAGGWTTISYTMSHDPNDSLSSTGLAGSDGIAVWNPSGSVGSPHGGFSATSSKCRVCHAVHDAATTSWRLLNATSSENACDVCHGLTGVTQKRPYGAKTYVVKGEHTRSTTFQNIPDSAVTTALVDGLTCNTCHSVHGANTLIGYGVYSDWDAKILRRNPNGDAAILANLVDGAAPSSEVTTTASAKKSNFCADCHNKNPNWDPNLDDTRPNGTSHVQGTGADGQSKVEGTTITVAYNALTNDGCVDCHSAPSGGNLVTVGATSTALSAFPHQTIGSKLLADTFSQGATATVVGDAERVLPEMDKVCASCHRFDGNFDATSSGVGITF